VDRKTLLDSKLFTGLKEREFDTLLRIVKPVECSFQRGATIWSEGDVVDGIGLLEHGVLLSKRYHKNGKVQLIHLLGPADIINAETGVSRSRISPVFIVADTPGSYIWLPNASLLRNPKIPVDIIRVLQSNLLAHLADETIRLIKKSDIYTRRTVRERVLKYLSMLREAEGDVVEIGMSHEEFSQYLLVDRSSLSEELNKMRRDGLIDYKNRKYTLYFPESE